MSVTCGEVEGSPNIEKNVISYDNINIGAWGGSCTCPDGRQYFVGDIAGKLINRESKFKKATLFGEFQF